MQPENEQYQQPEARPAGTPHAIEAQPTDKDMTAAPEAGAQAPTKNIDEDQVVRWQATEYIHRDKGPLWYGIFGVVVIGLMALGFFVFQTITFTILVPIMAAALVVYSRRPPATFDYTLSRKGLHINDKLYAYDQFKEFGLIHGDDQFAVMLVPRERFKPGVTVYFPEEVGEAVVDMLAARLPMHEAHIDPIDRLIRMLRI